MPKMDYKSAMNIKRTRDLLKLIESFGYIFARQNGSHMIYKPLTPSMPALPSIPAGRDISRGTLRNVLKVLYNGVNHGNA